MKGKKQRRDAESGLRSVPEEKKGRSKASHLDLPTKLHAKDIYAEETLSAHADL